MKLTVGLSVALVLASTASLVTAEIADNGFGTIENMEKFGLLTTPVMNLACGPIDSTDASTSETRRELGVYLRRGNKEKIRVAKTRPSIRIVDEDFKGKFCYRIRNAGIAFPTPLADQKIEILTEAPAIKLYIKQYMEMPSPENIAKRAGELKALLKEASVTDADLSNRYVLNFIPGQYRLGFKKQ